MTAKDQEALDMAHTHFRVEDGMVEIYRLLSSPNVEDDPAEPVKLLEVNRDTVPSGIMPLYFGPSLKSGRHFTLMILEVTPDEFDKIRREELPLPKGWVIGEAIEAPHAAVARS